MFTEPKWRLPQSMPPPLSSASMVARTCCWLSTKSATLCISLPRAVPTTFSLQPQLILKINVSCSQNRSGDYLSPCRHGGRRRQVPQWWLEHVAGFQPSRPLYASAYLEQSQQHFAILLPRMPQLILKINVSCSQNRSGDYLSPCRHGGRRRQGGSSASMVARTCCWLSTKSATLCISLPRAVPTTFCLTLQPQLILKINVSCSQNRSGDYLSPCRHGGRRPDDEATH
jgi:hypothetical protein